MEKKIWNPLIEHYLDAHSEKTGWSLAEALLEAVEIEKSVNELCKELYGDLKYWSNYLEIAQLETYTWRMRDKLWSIGSLD